MVHAAIGFATASNLLSTLACTASIGPGSTNLLTGAATATVNRVPVLLLPADEFVGRRGDPVMQALEHPREADVTRQRRVPAAERVLRSDRAARSSSCGRSLRRCECCSTPPRPGR